MKPVNFIKPITPQDHRSLMRWYRGTIALLLALMVGIVATTLKQILDTAHLQHQKNMLTPHSQKQAHTDNQQSVNEEHTLKERLALIKTWSEKQQLPATWLSAINTALLQAHMKLISLAVGTTQLELIAQCSDPQTAVQLAQTLTKTPHLYGLKLVSLQPHNVGGVQSYRATISSRIRQI